MKKIIVIAFLLVMAFGTMVYGDAYNSETGAFCSGNRNMETGAICFDAGGNHGDLVDSETGAFCSGIDYEEDEEKEDDGCNPNYRFRQRYRW